MSHLPRCCYSFSRLMLCGNCRADTSAQELPSFPRHHLGCNQGMPSSVALPAGSDFLGVELFCACLYSNCTAVVLQQQSQLGWRFSCYGSACLPCLGNYGIYLYLILLCMIVHYVDLCPMTSLHYMNAVCACSSWCCMNSCWP